MNMSSTLELELSIQLVKVAKIVCFKSFYALVQNRSAETLLVGWLLLEVCKNQ